MIEQGKDYNQKIKIWKYIGVYSVALVFMLLGIYIAKQCQQPKPQVIHYINVTDSIFGAIPNDTIDDYEAIQRAIDFAFKYDVDTIYFPLGTYIINSPLDYKTTNFKHEEPSYEKK